MDAIQFLTDEQTRIEDLAEQTLRFDTLADKMNYFENVRDALGFYLALEESDLFPKLEKLPGCEDFRNEALEDHRELRRLMREVEKTQEERALTNRISALCQCAAKYFEYERNALFPTLRDELSDSERQNLGATLQQSLHRITRKVA